MELLSVHFKAPEQEQHAPLSTISFFSRLRNHSTEAATIKITR
jgi:hypothetical protein